MKLTKQQRKRFEKYAPFYDLQGAVDDNNESSQMKGDRGEYVYPKLLKKGLNVNATTDLLRCTITQT